MDKITFVRKLDSMERYSLKGLAISIFSDPKKNIEEGTEKEEREFRQNIYNLLKQDSISIKSFLSEHDLKEEIINDFIEIKEEFNPTSISIRSLCKGVNHWVKNNSKKQLRIVVKFILEQCYLYVNHSDFQRVQKKIFEKHKFEIKKRSYERIEELFSRMVYSGFLRNFISINKVLLDFKDYGLSNEALSVFGDIMEDYEDRLRERLYNENILSIKGAIKVLPFKIKELSQFTHKFKELKYFI